MSLRAKAITGIKWLSVVQIAKNVLRVVSTVILARLLSPDDFGLMGMAVVFTAFVSVFSGVGISAAIIQRKEISDAALYSAFWVNMGLGLFFGALVISSAPLVAGFYQEARLTPLLMILGLVFIFAPLSSIHGVLLQKSLRFSTLAVIDVTAMSIGIVLGIGAAVLGAGVWSLVINTVSMSLASVILLWVLSSWRPSFTFAWSELRPMVNYSLNLTGFNLVNYFSRNADDILVGRYLGAQALGYYGFAYNVMLYPLQNISHVITRVMFPVLSQIQDDDDRFRNIYVKATVTTSLVTFPMMCGLLVVAEPLVLVVLGPKWEPIVPLMMILAPVGAIQSVGALVGNIYQAKGRTDIIFRWGIFAGFVYVPSFIIGLQWGIVGVASCYAIAGLMLHYPSWRIAFRLIDLPVGRMYAALARPAAAALTMLLILVVLKSLWPADWCNLWLLVTLIPTGMLIYGVLIYYLETERVKELLAILSGKD